MNLDREYREWESLRDRARALQREADLLHLHARQLEERLRRLEPSGAPDAPIQPAAAGPATPRPTAIPPRLPVMPVPAPVAQPVPAETPRLASDPLLTATAAPEPTSAPPETEWPADALPPVVAEAIESGASKSFELQMGTYWLVRLGVVMVLTAMVYFGYLAYQNFVVRMGPLGKVILMYGWSAALLGLGAWLPRTRESLRHYGQALFAGGLAAVYFTTYAAHHLPQLRVIPDPVVDGALLLAWTGFIVWLADRKKSELLSLFALGLAFYASAITRVGLFTLYSNVVLTGAAILFLVRNRWAGFSWASLIATYAGYVFWRFYAGDGWRWAHPGDRLWIGIGFLGAYWLLFTIAVFLSRRAPLGNGMRPAFLTVNNVAFFVLFLLTLLEVRSGGFWRFSLIYGSVLLGLCGLARRVLAPDRLAAEAYLVQGLLLVTAGLIARFTGPELGLLLAMEAVVLATFGEWIRDPVLRPSAAIAGILSTLATVVRLGGLDPAGQYLGAGVGAMLAFNAVWLRRKSPESEDTTSIDGRLAFWSALGLAVWAVTTWTYVPPDWRIPAMAIEALALTASVYVLRVRELALLSQGYLVGAQALWVLETIRPLTPPSAWQAALVLGVTLALSHWWPRQRQIPITTQARQLLEGLYALAMVAILRGWLVHTVAPSTWLVLSGCLALGLTGYGLFTRAWWIVGAAQLLALIAAGQFIRQVPPHRVDWATALVPMAVLLLLAIAGTTAVRRHEDLNEVGRKNLDGLACLYRWLTVGLGLVWVWEYVPAPHRVWFQGVVGVGLCALAVGRRNLEALAASGVFAAAALCGFWWPTAEAPPATWPNLLTLLALLGQQRALRRWSERLPLAAGIHTAVIVVGGLALWRWLERWVDPMGAGAYQTVAWALLAFGFFLAGLALRERVYRWLGLGVLAVALGRVMVVDVWKLEVLYRMLSFLGLGLVLLALGFLYNRFQERIRQYL